MSDFDQKNQQIENQVNADNVEQEIENSGTLSQEINAQKVRIGNKPVTCPNCKTSNKSSSRFCKSCGQSLTKLCKTCWTENDLSTVYCVSCGTEVESSKFSIPPQSAQIWKEKFLSNGWHVSPISESTSAILEKIEQPTNKNEFVILSVGISSNSIIHKASVRGREILPDPIYKDKVTGAIIFTNQRIIIRNYTDGWLAAYPHEYLDDTSASQGTDFINFEKKDTVTFSLDYKSLGNVRIHKVMPSLLKPRGLISRMTSSDMFNAQMDLQTTMINAAIGGKIQESYNENTIFSGFFEYIVELQKSYHKNSQDYSLGISPEQFIYTPPVTQSQQTSKSSDSSCVVIAIILFIIVSAIGFIGFFCFMVLLFSNQ